MILNYKLSAQFLYVPTTIVIASRGEMLSELGDGNPIATSPLQKEVTLNLFYNSNSISTLYSQVVAPTLTKQNTRGPLYQPTGANLNLNVNKN